MAMRARYLRCFAFAAVDGQLTRDLLTGIVIFY